MGEEEKKKSRVVFYYVDFLDCTKFLTKNERKLWKKVGLDLLLNEEGDLEIFKYTNKDIQIKRETGEDSTD